MIKALPPGLRVLQSGVAASRTCHPAEVLCWDNFLPADVRDQLFAHVVENRETRYQPSQVSQDAAETAALDPEFRRSLVVKDDEYVRELLLPPIAGPRDIALARAGYGRVPLGEVELQLTASGDRDRFGIHTDDGSADSPTFLRLLTFVYYLHRLPRPFRGGALRVYDSQLVAEGWDATGTYIDVDPADNRLVMFLSDRYHEVLAVDCASSAFADRRFTINGWFRSARDLSELVEAGVLG